MSVETPLAIDLTNYIEVRLFGERPHIRGRRIPVATIAHAHHDPGWDVARLGYEFTLSDAEVLAALLYYEEYKEAIAQQESRYRALLDAAQRAFDEQHDEHMPRAVATALKDTGSEVIVAVDVGMTAKDDDAEQLPYAALVEAVLVTRDQPFAGRTT